MSPTTFSTVAGASIIVAIIVKIGNAFTGKPINVNIIISEIVPPPIGTAVTNKVTSNHTTNTLKNPTLLPNRDTRNIILNAEPIIEPSLWKLVPRGIMVSAISAETPNFFAVSIFTGIDAALEHVASAVTVDGIIFFQNTFTPLIPAAMYA